MSESVDAPRTFAPSHLRTGSQSIPYDSAVVDGPVLLRPTATETPDVVTLGPRTPIWMPTVAQILMAAFAARFAVGIATDSVLWADEVFQYLEQAHRLVFGAGMIPWEFEHGIRSWAVPLAIGAVLKPLQLLGLDSPHIYQPAVKAVLCAASLVLPYSVYRLGRSLVSEGVARMALVFTAFWYELLSYAHRTTIDALATYAAFASLALLFASKRPRAIAGCGVLAGLTIVLRFQLLPTAGVMALLALWRWRRSAWPWAIGFVGVLAAGGALDYYTWDVWFSSSVLYFQLNLMYGVASMFGTDPFYWYVPVLIVLSGGLALAGGVGLLLTARSTWPLIAVGAVTLVAFSAIGHKETRYVFSLVPLWLLGLGALSANRGELIAKTVPRAAALAPWLARGVIAGFFAISALGLFNLLPFQNRVLPANIARNDARQAYRTLADDDDVVAVLDLSDIEPYSLAPYYDLHHNVPIYWRFGDGFTTAQADPARYTSHVLAPVSAGGPDGFRLLREVGQVAVWRRMVDPSSTIPPPEHSSRITALQPIPTLPTVNPRW